MEKINTEVTQILLLGRNIPFSKEIMELKSGESLKINRSEWNKKGNIRTYYQNNKKTRNLVYAKEFKDFYLIVKK